jgi:hypothetical protein
MRTELANFTFQIPHPRTHQSQDCPYLELIKDETFSRIGRPWQQIWKSDITHRCGEHRPTQNIQHAASQDTGDDPSSKPVEESEVPHGLEMWLNQSSDEEPWNEVFGFYTSKGGNKDVFLEQK